MSRNSKITKEETLLFLRRINDGMTAVSAAKLACYSVSGLKQSVQRLGLDYKKPKPLRSRILERKVEIETSGKSQHWWAKELKCTQPAISRVFKELGIQSDYQLKQKGKADDRARRYEEYHKALMYILSNGKQTPEAIKTLGLGVNMQEFRCFAKSIGINLSEWQFAWQRYGSWLVLPGPFEVRPPVNYIVPAVCLACGKHGTLNLNNARSNKTSTCISCSAQNRIRPKIKNLTTGEEYSSVMGWAKSIGMARQYQTLRIRIRMQEELTIGGFTYTLMNDEESKDA